MTGTLILCIFLFSSSLDALNFNGKALGGPFLKFHALDPPVNDTNRVMAEDQYFTQRLDHFDAQNTDNWQQRYLMK